ncbi:beta-1,3-galactosyltransferase 1-like [Tubulanus polymorphus]|uniref:beta-1,3-galactosyltransferase 1-like n=1 Tax=Tubulanus polymorphus TaxID=672921 RepID=UPI003DA372D7
MNPTASTVLYFIIVVLLLLNLSRDYEKQRIHHRNFRVIEFRYSTEPPKWNPDTFLEDGFRGKLPTCRIVTTLVAVITSAPENYDKRAAIRESWGGFGDDSINHESWRYIFLIGQSRDRTTNIRVIEESRIYKDILIGSYVDTYRNLTQKVIHGLRWVEKYCRPEFLLKTDDDCYINRPLLVEYLQYYNSITENLYVGRIFLEKRDVIRASSSKWAVSVLDYKRSRYPRYASGIGYIISVDVLQKVIKEMKYVRPFPNEDAYIGVIINRLGIEPVMSYRFTMYYFTWSDCNHRYMFCLHNVNTTEQKMLYRKSLNAHKYCPGVEPIKTWD